MQAHVQRWRLRRKNSESQMKWISEGAVTLPVRSFISFARVQQSFRVFSTMFDFYSFSLQLKKRLSSPCRFENTQKQQNSKVLNCFKVWSIVQTRKRTSSQNYGALMSFRNVWWTSLSEKVFSQTISPRLMKQLWEEFKPKVIADSS